MKNKRDEVDLLLGSLSVEFDVMLFSETGLALTAMCAPSITMFTMVYPGPMEEGVGLLYMLKNVTHIL